MADNATQFAAINACKDALDGVGKPYFLYFMTTDGTDKLVAISYKKDDTIGALEVLSSYDKEGISATISGHIDNALQDIFKSTSAVNNPQQPAEVNPNLLGGGSRSRKHRRRHKRRHNTKRRYRK